MRAAARCAPLIAFFVTSCWVNKGYCAEVESAHTDSPRIDFSNLIRILEFDQDADGATFTKQSLIIVVGYYWSGDNGRNKWIIRRDIAPKIGTINPIGAPVFGITDLYEVVKSYVMGIAFAKIYESVIPDNLSFERRDLKESGFGDIFTGKPHKRTLVTFHGVQLALHDNLLTAQYTPLSYRYTDQHKSKNSKIESEPRDWIGLLEPPPWLLRIFLPFSGALSFLCFVLLIGPQSRPSLIISNMGFASIVVATVILLGVPLWVESIDLLHRVESFLRQIYGDRQAREAC